ncbi:patatin-like phospholipase family protein [Rubrimonas sp.]|uniref:patatin-like phospholipase family protein n=1 Tax=Rubrimonas sp. TaxID=2036015 RepID=UPI002FDDAA83
MTPFRILCLCAALAVSACESLAPMRVAPTAEVYARAVVPGLPDVREWGDELDATAVEAGRARVERDLRDDWIAAGRPPEGLERNILALSGGGPDGAFAAGLLSGWSRTGTRPEFDLVTGVSVGGLIAPFAFLGSDHDSSLRMIFTELGSEDVAVLQLFGVLRGALGVANTQPLRESIRRLIDEPFLDAVAREYAKGRSLLIATTNIDAARPVIWDMGAIAAAGEVGLFHDVMLASASIPGAFPPVGIEVEADGERFTEFHVDGGVTRSVFVGPNGIENVLVRTPGFPVRRTTYVIQNNGLAPLYRPVDARLASIASRSFSTLIRAQTEGDLERIYRATSAVGSDFRLIFVPPGFQPVNTATFDRDYMRTLFDFAYQEALDGIDWLTAPPEILGRRRLERELRDWPAAPPEILAAARGQ